MRGGRPRSLRVRPRAADWRTPGAKARKPHIHPVSHFTYIKLNSPNLARSRVWSCCRHSSAYALVLYRYKPCKNRGQGLPRGLPRRVTQQTEAWSVHRASHTRGTSQIQDVDSKRSRVMPPQSRPKTSVRRDGRLLSLGAKAASQSRHPISRAPRQLPAALAGPILPTTSSGRLL